MKIQIVPNVELLSNAEELVMRFESVEDKLSHAQLDVLQNCLKKLLKDRNDQCEAQLKQYLRAKPIFPSISLEIHFDVETESIIKRIFDLLQKSGKKDTDIIEIVRATNVE